MRRIPSNVIAKLIRVGDELLVSIDGREIEVNGFRPVDFLLMGLVYGLGVRFMDRFNVNEYTINCDFDGDGVICKGPCSGYEERCLVFRIATKGLLKFNCSDG